MNEFKTTNQIRRMNDRRNSSFHHSFIRISSLIREFEFREFVIYSGEFIIDSSSTKPAAENNLHNI